MGWRMQELQGLSHARLRAAVHCRGRRLRRLWSRTSFIRTRSAHDPFGSMLAQCKSMHVLHSLRLRARAAVLCCANGHMCACAHVLRVAMISPTAVTVGLLMVPAAVRAVGCPVLQVARAHG